MAQKQARSAGKAPKHRVRFSIIAPDAANVAVAGDFNKWDASCHCLAKKKNGRWEKTLTLSPGAYQYKFVVDGTWRLDPGNDRACDNQFGTRNNILVVSDKK
jgi:1,4-alpha-glucan branching enzyme